VDQKAVNISSVAAANPKVKAGGEYTPDTCKARNKVAIVVPYRNRPEQLNKFLNNIHPFLQRQEIQYKIYIINQTDSEPFNRAMLLNIGFMEATSEQDWDCCIFHDVDLLPEDDRNLYTCPEEPRHMSVAVDKFKYKLPYAGLFGGVSAITVDQFRKLNGYSNEFWGWGGEDDDMYKRIRYHRLRITRYKPEIARYSMIKHQPEAPNKNRMKVLKTGIRRYRTDGLSNLKYDRLGKDQQPLFTAINVVLSHKNTG